MNTFNKTLLCLLAAGCTLPLAGCQTRGEDNPFGPQVAAESSLITAEGKVLPTLNTVTGDSLTDTTPLTAAGPAGSRALTSSKSLLTTSVTDEVIIPARTLPGNRNALGPRSVTGLSNASDHLSRLPAVGRGSIIGLGTTLGRNPTTGADALGAKRGDWLGELWSDGSFLDDLMGGGGGENDDDE